MTSAKKQYNVRDIFSLVDDALKMHAYAHPDIITYMVDVTRQWVSRKITKIITWVYVRR